MKKAFTMIELTIAIALLGTIMVAVFAIFTTATKNYRVQSQKSFLQKELNFTADALANELKLAHNVTQNTQSFVLSSTTLILSLPAADENGNFIYNGDIQEYDTLIYSKEGTNLRKVLIPSATSARAPKDFTVLTNVNDVNFNYSPDSLNPLSINTSITVSRAVGKSTVTLSASRSAFLRNK